MPPDRRSSRVVPVLIGLVGASRRLRRDHRRRAMSRSRCSTCSTGSAIRTCRCSASGRSARRCFTSASSRSAHDHLARGVELYQPAFHKPRVWETGIDPGIFCRCELARTLSHARVLRIRDCGACSRPWLRRGRSSIPSRSPLRCSSAPCSTSLAASRRQVLGVFDELSALCRAHGIAQELQWGAPLARPGARRAGPHRSGHRRTEGRPRSPHAHALGASASLLFRPLCRRVPARARGSTKRRRRSTNHAPWRTRPSQHAYDAEHRRLEAEVLLARGDYDGTERAYMERSRSPVRRVRDGSSCARRAATRAF